MKSKTGKNRGQRALALLLTLIMCVSLLGNTALAAPMGQTPSNNQQQIVDGWLAADDHGNLGDVITNGEWRATDGDRVRVSKTIAPTSKENDFEVTLTVETKENLQETISGPDAAVTLVIDVSASMSQCAICGGDYHESHVFQDDGPQSDDTYKTYIEATKSDYPEYSAAYDLMYEMYGGKEQDGKCDFPLNVSYSVGKDTWYTYCNQTEEDHVTHES